VDSKPKKKIASPKGEALLCDPQGGFWPDVYFLPWDSYLFEIMSDSIDAVRAAESEMPKED